MTGASRESSSNAVTKQNSQTSQSLQDASPKVIHSINDSHSLQITQHKLNGANYVECSQSVIDRKRRLDYLTGEAAAPEIGTPAYKKWKSEDSLVKACLLNSMEPAISCVYLYYKTSHAIWDMVEEMYSNLGNSAQIFELKSAQGKRDKGILV